MLSFWVNFWPAVTVLMITHKNFDDIWVTINFPLRSPVIFYSSLPKNNPGCHEGQRSTSPGWSDLASCLIVGSSGFNLEFAISWEKPQTETRCVCV